MQELLGHSDVKTTMIYTHVVNQDDGRVVSPLDRLVKQEAVAKEVNEATQEEREVDADEGSPPESCDSSRLAALPVENFDQIGTHHCNQPMEEEDAHSRTSPVGVLAKENDAENPPLEVIPVPAMARSAVAARATMKRQSSEGRCLVGGDDHHLSAVLQSIAQQSIQEPKPRKPSSPRGGWLSRWLPSSWSSNHRTGGERQYARRATPFALHSQSP